MNIHRRNPAGKPSWLALCLAWAVLSTAGCATSPPPTLDQITAALSAPDRSEADKANDARRKARDMLAFIDVRPGMRAMDVNAGAGYTAEMLAGAIRETSAGEIEAAQAYGMGHWRTMWRVILPSAFRRSLPAYSNEVVMMLQSTSLASAVPSMIDVTSAASRVYSKFYLPFEAFLLAAGIYLVATFMLVGVFRLAERHFLAYLAPRQP